LLPYVVPSFQNGEENSKMILSNTPKPGEGRRQRRRRKKKHTEMREIQKK
jgi:hypothetical protein